MLDVDFVSIWILPSNLFIRSDRFQLRFVSLSADVLLSMKWGQSYEQYQGSGVALVSHIPSVACHTWILSLKRVRSSVCSFGNLRHQKNRSFCRVIFQTPRFPRMRASRNDTKTLCFLTYFESSGDSTMNWKSFDMRWCDFIAAVDTVTRASNAVGGQGADHCPASVEELALSKIWRSGPLSSGQCACVGRRAAQ